MEEETLEGIQIDDNIETGHSERRVCTITNQQANWTYFMLTISFIILFLFEYLIPPIFSITNTPFKKQQSSLNTRRFNFDLSGLNQFLKFVDLRLAFEKDQSNIEKFEVNYFYSTHDDFVHSPSRTKKFEFNGNLTKYEPIYETSQYINHDLHLSVTIKFQDGVCLGGNFQLIYLSLSHVCSICVFRLLVCFVSIIFSLLLRIKKEKARYSISVIILLLTLFISSQPFTLVLEFFTPDLGSLVEILLHFFLIGISQACFISTIASPLASIPAWAAAGCYAYYSQKCNNAYPLQAPQMSFVYLFISLCGLQIIVNLVCYKRFHAEFENDGSLYFAISISCLLANMVSLFLSSGEVISNMICREFILFEYAISVFYFSFINWPVDASRVVQQSSEIADITFISDSQEDE